MMITYHMQLKNRHGLRGQLKTLCSVNVTYLPASNYSDLGWDQRCPQKVRHSANTINAAI